MKTEMFSFLLCSVKASVKQQPACDKTPHEGRPNRRLLMDFYAEGETASQVEATKVEEANKVEAGKLEAGNMETTSQPEKNSLHILAHTSKETTKLLKIISVMFKSFLFTNRNSATYNSKCLLYLLLRELV
jgi:hypothetical protein